MLDAVGNSAIVHGGELLHIIGDESPGRNGKSESIKTGAAMAAAFRSESNQERENGSAVF